MVRFTMRVGRWPGYVWSEFLASFHDPICVPAWRKTAALALATVVFGSGYLFGLSASRDEVIELREVVRAAGRQIGAMRAPGVVMFDSTSISERYRQLCTEHDGVLVIRAIAPKALECALSTKVVKLADLGDVSEERLGNALPEAGQQP